MKMEKPKWKWRKCGLWGKYTKILQRKISFNFNNTCGVRSFRMLYAWLWIVCWLFIKWAHACQSAHTMLAFYVVCFLFFFFFPFSFFLLNIILLCFVVQALSVHIDIFGQLVCSMCVGKNTEQHFDTAINKRMENQIKIQQQTV